MAHMRFIPKKLCMLILHRQGFSVTLTVLPLFVLLQLTRPYRAFVEYFYETPRKIAALASVGLTIIGWVVILKVLQKTFDV